MEICRKEYEALRGKRLLLWGYGREGRSTHRFLRRLLGKQTLWVADNRPPEDGLDEDTIFLPAGEWSPDFEDFDLVFRSPGIPLLNPAIQRDRLCSQTNLFLSCFAGQTIGITGTKGKSTTAALTSHILKAAGHKTVLLGNIGLPCLDYAENLTKDTVVVFELSCHQLEDALYSPRVAVHLNLFEDHLDHYGTFARYASAKDHIFLHQKGEKALLLGEQLYLSRKNAAPYAETIGYREDCHVAVFRDRIAVKEHDLTLQADRRVLPGLQGAYCIGAAYWICRQYGVSDSCFMSALSGFKGLPHRLQCIGEVEGVRYYDDSISTICEATIRALEALGDVNCLLLGGMDRGIDYSDLAAYLRANPVEHILLMPDSGWRMAEILSELQGITLYKVKDLAEAVELAKSVTKKGKSCLLSPAAASYGFFRDFAERGERFAALVNSK